MHYAKPRPIDPRSPDNTDGILAERLVPVPFTEVPLAVGFINLEHSMMCMGNNIPSEEARNDNEYLADKTNTGRRTVLKAAGALTGISLIGDPVVGKNSHNKPPAHAEKWDSGSVINVNPGDNINEIVKKAANVTPTSRQQAWKKLERTAFLHFGVNTFTDQEWGTGLEDPDVFHPTDFDPTQWMEALRDGGFKSAILTIKHHDGFCLYPSDYTDFDVASSAWRDGQGDIVREVADAAHDAGLKFGFYLSPADLHEIKAPDGRYGDGSKAKPTKIPTPVSEEQETTDQNFTYTLDNYNRYFMNQLYEIITEYGPVNEVWLDGANPEPGIDQTYNEKAWYDLVRKLQPNAVIAVGGPDARWAGNEEGIARKSEWSPLPFQNDSPVFRHEGINQPDTDLGSREKLAQDPDYLAWYPAEADTSIRPGWFYHADEDDQVLSIDELVDVYYKSVGRNANLLLNVPPDQHGLLHETDVKRIAKLDERISKTFDINLAHEAKVSDSSPGKSQGRFGANKAVDENPNTYWQPRPRSSTGKLIFDLGESETFNRISLQEATDVGQRIESFALDIRNGSSWQKIASGTTVGYKRLLRFDMVETQKVRLRIEQSRATPTVASFGLYRSS